MAVLAASLLWLLCLAWAATGISEDWMTEILEAHNTFRCMHDVPLFEWDDAAAASAQAHVDAGVLELSGGLVGDEYCTELHAWSSDETAAEAAGRWYAEIENSPGGTGAVPEYSSSCRGYTTLVWKSSTKLGCGRGTRNDRGGNYTACYYCPEANVGSFADNVFPASRTAAQCADPNNPTDPIPTPTAAPTPCLSPSEVGLSADWMTEILEAHNTFRCMHDVPFFEWDDAAAATAQAHVDAGEYDLTSGYVGDEYCTELHAWSSDETAAEAAGRWYAEIENSPGGTGAVPEYTGQCRGYTTLVWKSSVRLGCGRGPRNDKGGDWTLCYYCPETNVGSFADNVFAASKTAEQCAFCASGGPGPSPSPSPSPSGSGLDSENLDADSAVQASLAALAVLLLIGVAAIAV